MMKRLNKLNLSSDDPSRSNHGNSFLQSAALNCDSSHPSPSSQIGEEGVENNGYADDDISVSTRLNKILSSNEMLDKNSRRDDTSPSKKLSINGSSESSMRYSNAFVQTEIKTVDKSCQVSTPMLQRANHQSQTAELSHSNGEIKSDMNLDYKETSFINNKVSSDKKQSSKPNNKNTISNLENFLSLSNNIDNKLSNSHKKVSKIKSHSKRSRSKSENEKVNSD